MAWPSSVIERATKTVVNGVLKLDDPVRVRLMGHRTWMSNVLAGGGVAYALSQDKYKYGQAALAFWMPSLYAGYHVFQNREAVRNFVK